MVSTTTTMAPGPGFVAGHVTAVGDSVMLDAAPDLAADIPGIDIEAVVSRQWDTGIALLAELKAEDRLGAVVVVDLGTNGPITVAEFQQMMAVLARASRVVFVTVHLPALLFLVPVGERGAERGGTALRQRPARRFQRARRRPPGLVRIRRRPHGDRRARREAMARLITATIKG